ncbi:MAG TPA: YceI family protein [Candidatus Eisenbacteria bacterium]
MTRFLPPLTLAAVLALSLAPLAAAEPQNFGFDKAHSEVGFDIRHIFTKVHGRFNDYSGSVSYDPANLTASSVEVSIADSSIYTANERRDNDLRSPNFFDVAKNPAITFKSTKIIPGKDANHFQVVGDLGMHGTTKPVTLDVEFLGVGPVGVNGHSMGMQAGFIGKTTIKRQDWGITWNRTLDQGGMMLGDDVEITLNIAAVSLDKSPSAPAAPAAEKK